MGFFHIIHILKKTCIIKILVIITNNISFNKNYMVHSPSENAPASAPSKKWSISQLVNAVWALWMWIALNWALTENANAGPVEDSILPIVSGKTLEQGEVYVFNAKQWNIVQATPIINGVSKITYTGPIIITAIVEPTDNAIRPPHLVFRDKLIISTGQVVSLKAGEPFSLVPVEADGSLAHFSSGFLMWNDTNNPTFQLWNVELHVNSSDGPKINWDSTVRFVSDHPKVAGKSFRQVMIEKWLPNAKISDDPDGNGTPLALDYIVQNDPGWKSFMEIRRTVTWGLELVFPDPVIIPPQSLIVNRIINGQRVVIADLSGKKGPIPSIPLDTSPGRAGNSWIFDVKVEINAD